MNNPRDGFDYLEQLRAETGSQRQSFQKLGDYLGYKAREKGIPISGKFELTPLCNFSCKMCYVHLDVEQLNGQSILPVDTWKDLMYQAWQAGMISAALTGGECLAYLGFEELFLYLQSLGCEVAVLTNGFLLDERRIDFFRNHRPSDIQVTLYGWNDDVYERVTGRRAFSTVINNIKQVKEAGLPLYISITPNKYLGEDLIETIKVAKEICKNVVINTFYKTPREETGRSGQEDDVEMDLYVRAFKYYNQLEGIKTTELNEADLPPCGGPCHETAERGLTCGGGRSGFAIDWKGTMTPCTDLSMICGYPLKEGFSAAWSRINQAVNQWPRVPECIECAYNEICNNCAARSLQFAAPGEKPIGICQQTRELVRNGIKKIAECKD